jgi:hypothetical protein
VQEESVVKAARELRKDKSRGTVKSAEWSESDGLLMFRGKIYVPNDRDLRCRIIEQHHNTRIAGHAGRSSSYPAITNGPRCPATSASTLSTVTCATCHESAVPLSFSIISLSHSAYALTDPEQILVN